MNDINKNLNNFLEYLQQKKKTTKQTVNNYSFYLHRFFNQSNIRQASDITKEKIDLFKNYLSTIRNQKKELLKINTQNYHLIALRSFLEYLKKKNIHSLPFKEIVLKKQIKKHYKPLEESDIDLLLSSPLHEKNPGIIQKRDKAILELLLCSGLKVSELASLKKENINFSTNSINILRKKKSRSLNLSNQASYAVHEYLKIRNDKFNALFIRHDKAKKRQLSTVKKETYQLTPRTIQRIIKKYSKKTNLGNNITPEKLRQAYAVHLKKQGYDIKSIQSILGHNFITTTKLYTSN
ncbi:MAG: tyrosine-type recombinase/integrase [Candidatus Kerfeldbacteria bacterium]